MKISIIGTNGMLSVALTKAYFNGANEVNVYGLFAPEGYECSCYTAIDLVKSPFDVTPLLDSDVVFYAAGAGVQAALSTDSSLMYQLNVIAPIDITISLKKKNYKGVYVSFGSYMEIGLNDDEGKSFTENDVVTSSLPVTNDYALSKRLYSRYVNDLMADYTHWHFILPNMFSYNDIKPGTRLIPYILQYIQNYKEGAVEALPSFSAGLQMRQFILQEDVFDVLDKALEKHIPSGIYNVGGGEFMSIRSLIERVFIYYGVPCSDDFFGKEVRRDNDIKSLRIDGAKLWNAIGYLPDTTIETLLSKAEF